METRTEITHLPMELVTHISRFFSPQSRNKLKEVSKLWHAHSSLVYHFYVLGSPIPVQRFDDTNQITLKKQIPQEEIDQSFKNIPENGFMVFPTYRDAYLYAHNRFTSWIRNPNFHNGIMGTGIDKKISFTSERPYYDHILHHPVIFEVSFDNGFPLSLIKHPLMLSNLGGSDYEIEISSIREPHCKSHLEVLSSKLEIGFIDNKVSPVLLHDSKTTKHDDDLEAVAQSKSTFSLG